MTWRRTTMRYGPDRRQVGDLWLPSDAAGPVPVVVLVHGGFWRAPYTKRLLNRLAADVAARGWAAWNVEYRRTGRWGGSGGWPSAVDDVASALAWVGGLEGVDPDRVAICGHSAGAQLALCAAARHVSAPLHGGSPSVTLRVAVALAGVLDLVDAADRDLGGGAVRQLLGGRPTEVPGRYAAASPLALLPLGVDQVVAHGEDDSVVPAAMSERYAAAATAAGDRVVHEVLSGQGHLAMIHPGRPGWRLVARHLERLLGEPCVEGAAAARRDDGTTSRP